MKYYQNFYKDLINEIKQEMLVTNTEFQENKIVINTEYDITNKVLSKRFYNIVPETYLGSKHGDYTQYVWLNESQFDNWIIQSIIEWFREQEEFVKSEIWE